MKRVLTVVITLFVLLSSPLASAGVAIQHWQTASGARVYFVASPALPLVDIQLDFAAGSMFDPPGQAGLAALTRTTLDLGAGELDETAIAEQLADLGALLAGGADTDRASISLRTLNSPDKLQPALAILARVISAPRFDPAVFAREQTRTAAALKDALTRPDSIGGRAFWQALYPNHPYGRQATPTSLAGLTVSAAQDFHRRYYVAANATLTLVGALSRAEAEQLAETLLAALPRGEAAVLPPPPTAVRGSQKNIAHPASQAHVQIGLAAIERGHPDFFPLLVGNYTLGGGGFVSRLMREVRDRRGYAYSVYSYFSPLKQAGPFQIGLQTKRSQAREATQLARSLLEDFVKHGPSPEELAAAKANLTGSFPLRLDSNKKLLENVANIGFYGLPLDYLDTYQAKVAAVTVDDVKKAFSRHVRSGNLSTITVAGE